MDRHLFSEAVALELGAGVGLVSAVAAPYCRTVISTDVELAVLQQLEKNMQQEEYSNVKVPLVRASTAAVSAGC